MPKADPVQVAPFRYLMPDPAVLPQKLRGPHTEPHPGLSLAGEHVAMCQGNPLPLFCEQEHHALEMTGCAMLQKKMPTVFPSCSAGKSRV